MIHEVGDADGVMFIAMELIRGEKLSALLGRGRLPLPRALTFATEIAEALARSHETGVVHRDLKPANVMVTGDGHVKVIDFGLAKMYETKPQEAATVSVHGPRTEEGLVLGTAAYMSPEQARGLRVDHRSDIFALGVTLYEMVTGRPAFQGQSNLDTMQAVLTQPVPPLSAAADAPADAIAELQRIIAKCTSKDADDRYQGMKDLVVDLRAARRRIESSQSVAVATPASGHTALAAPARGPAGLVAAGLIALAVLAGAAVWWWAGRGAEPPPSSPSRKPGMAVLYFDNNTGDQSLDWMRTGLTDMMVTDLSQSPEFEVMGTDRLAQILMELKRADDRVLAADLVQEIASRAAVDKVLVGSYVKAGNTIRISARLQDARTGRIVTAERVEGAGESSLFNLVDELTRRIKAKMTEIGGSRAGALLAKPGDGPKKEEAGLDRGLTDITTSSIEAYRYYAEGINFHERGLSAQAAPLLEKAIAIDPRFAMAYAKLAVVHNNLVAFDKRDEFAKKALELTDRLTTRERYYIEGFYYSNRPETWAQAIDAYEKGLTLHPEHQASRHNLGLILAVLERYPEAIEQYEEMRRRRTSNPTSYENLADALIQTGNIHRSREVADEFVRQYPESAAGLRMLGMTLIADGQLDRAREAFQKSESLDPLDVTARLHRRSVAMLQERWSDAATVDQELAGSPNPFSQFQGLLGGAWTAAAHGRRQVALDLLERCGRVPGLPRQQRAATRNRLAEMLLRDGNAAAALAQTELGLVDARGRDAEFRALQLTALAQAALGRTGESAKTLDLLESRGRMLPSDRETRRVHWTRGQLAYQRGDTPTAIAELDKAVGMLPPQGPPTGPPSSHVELWYDAALANIKAGRDAQAAPLLERIQSGHERAFALELWSRTFFLLGQIYERRGDTARARQQYTHFVDLWRDGDLERNWVAEAQKKLSAANSTR